MVLSKKSISFGFILLIITSLFFMACSKKTETTSTSGKTTLRVLNYFDLTSANSADEIPVVWQAFENANADIQLDREDLFNEPFHQKTEAYAAAGRLPDVIYAWPSGRSTTLHTKKLLKDLMPLIKRDGLDKQFTAAALDPNAQGGGYVAILPMALTATHSFYINNQVLEACGLTPAKTYQELKAQVPILKAKGYDTVIMSNGEVWVMQSCLFSMLAGRFGGAGWEHKILSGETKFTDTDFVNALSFVKTMYNDGVLSSKTMVTSYGDGPGKFSNGDSAYYVDGDWRVGAFITDKSTNEALISPENQEKYITVSVFPEIEGAKLNRSTSLILGTGWGINASVPDGSVQEEAAWRLIKWLVSKDIETWRLENGAISAPARNDIDVSSLKLEPLQKAMSNLHKTYDTATIVFDGVFDSSIANVLNNGLQEIGLGSKTPQQVAESVQKAFDTWKSTQN